MIITAWILLILFSLSLVLNFIDIFIKGTTKERIQSGMKTLIVAMTILIVLSYLHII